MPGANKIAVVAVHGVGDHAPFAAASDLAHLLGRLRNENGGPHYGEFREEIVHIPVKPCPVTEVRDADSAHRFAYEALKNHEDAGPTNTYRTIRLSCTEPPGNAETVDVWEMHWADLSQVRSGIVSFLVDLYHLILNLPVVAARTLRDDAGAGVVSGLADEVQWLLTHAIPLFNLILLGVGLAVVVIAAAMELDSSLVPWTAAGWITVLWGIIVQQTLLRKVSPAALTAIMIVPGAGLGLLAALRDDFGIAAVTALSAITFIGLAWGLYRALALRIGGSPSLAAWMCAAVLMLFAWQVWQIRSDLSGETVLRAGLVCFIGIYEILRLLWTFVVAFVLAVCALGVFTAKWQTVKTYAVATVLPAMLFVLITSGLWFYLGPFVAQPVPSEAFHGLEFPEDNLAGFATIGKLVTGAPCTVNCGVIGDPGENQIEEFVRLLVLRDADGLVFWLMATLLALLVAGLSLAPPVATEAFFPTNRSVTEALGKWLNFAFRGLFLAGLILFVSMPLFHLVPIPARNTNALLATLTLVALVTLRYAPKIKIVLDVALDVECHLRLRPHGATPRAKISARYASLLRMLDGYDAIVIVAHSQGAVITADLLRFLQKQECGVPVKPVYLLTMGCPLRQLYRRRFPVLYDWAEKPKPAEIGVHAWVNAFRSGDYIGRSLWRAEDDFRSLSLSGQWKAIHALSELDPKAHLQGHDFCLGPGAHTRYWGDHAEAIAMLTDHLVAAASLSAERAGA